MLLAKAVRVLSAIGQLATRASHSITQQIEVSAILTLQCWATPHLLLHSLFLLPTFLYLPLLRGRSQTTLNNMTHTSVAGFKSLNSYRMSGHALNLACYLTVGCHLWGTHLQCLSEVTCAELKALAASKVW